MNPTEAILEAAKAGDAAKVAELVKGNPALASARNEKGESAILAAQYRGHRQVVDVLVRAGAELNIYEASAVGEIDRVRAHVAADAKLVNTFSPDGFTPLSLAAYFGHPAVAEFLLQCGAEVNVAATNAMKVMPLHAAASGRHTAVVEMLLSHKADPNARQHGGYAPLHSAAGNGLEDMVRLLLKHGADAYAKDDTGQTPRDMAAAKGHTAVAELLA